MSLRKAALLVLPGTALGDQNSDARRDTRMRISDARDSDRDVSPPVHDLLRCSVEIGERSGARERVTGVRSRVDRTGTGTGGR